MGAYFSLLTMRHLLLLLWFSAFLYDASSLNSDGMTLLSLMKHWKSVPPAINSSWNALDSTPCSWLGVQCNQVHHVVFLNVTGYPISGQLGPEIGQLSQLQTLIFSLDYLSGEIPAELGNCTDLEILNLSENNLIGKIPHSLKNLQKLRHLILYTNLLTGEISESLFQIPHLELVFLFQNNLSGPIPNNVENSTKLSLFHLERNRLSGAIPSSIGNCTKLQKLFLYDNQLQGVLPESLNNLENLLQLHLNKNLFQGIIPLGPGKCQNLRVLDLSNNIFNGGIPTSIWNLSNLEEIYVAGNNLSGELPLEMADHKKLKNIHLFGNQFSGVIPQTLGINSSLEQLDFTDNKFTGNIPPNLCYRKQLVLLLMGQNQLQGNIPLGIGKCPTLERLILGGNNLSGTLPQFGRSPYLSFIDISGNQISGKIPSSLGNCINLTDVDLSMNRFNGKIPSELGLLANLVRVNFSNNNLEGPLPPQLSNCNKIEYFDVGFNSLNGSIPSNLRSWTKLFSLSLGGNHFSGGLPDFLSEFESLSELEIGGNIFGGKIPRSIGTLQNLMYGLNLSANGLVGEIPSEIVKLKMLQKLDLSLNNLTGSIKVLEELSSLLEINISYNSFDGPIPQSLMIKFANSSPSSFLGNSGLCVSCLPSDDFNCYKNSNLKPCDHKSTQKRHPSKIKVVIISLGSSVIFVVLLLGLFYMLFLRRSKYKLRSSSILKKVMKSTKNLNDQYIIGRGAHGVVYRVQLGPDKIFALKKLQFAENERQTQIMINEIQTLAKIRHRNLVKLKNFWFKKDYGLILYNYMQNGSLHDVLHGMNSPPSLKWSIRHKIVVGIAHGLSYLHHDCDPIIVHRDIKPKNILLDSDMEPHIADFGISKLLDQSSTSTSSVSVPGTLGYIAPETAYTTVKSTKSDVYSYGVVLLEVSTRREVLDSSLSEGEDMVTWVSNVWEKSRDVAEIVDQGLADEVASNLSVREQVNQVLSVALRCTEKDPVKRPTMRDVVKLLLV